jgi:hypothetical protein
MGLARRSGFQTKAMTSGVSAETRRVIEAFVGAYPMPKNRNTEEGQPVALKSFSPGNDLWCVSLTQYRKFDWTGEGLGNFFSHSLIFSRDEFLAFGADPFLLLRADCFKKDDPGTSTALDPLDISIPDRPAKAALDGLRSKAGGRVRLSQLVDALLASMNGQRPVLILANPADVMVLLEGIITILPASVRARLAFSSYGARPVTVDEPKVAGATQRMLCWGTTGATGETYSEIDYEHTYRVFDYESNRFSSAAGATQFADWMASRVFDKDDEVEQCVEFLSTYSFGPDSLDSALAFYLIAEAAGSGDSRQMELALRFAESNSNSAARCDASIAKLLGASAPPEFEARITALLLRLAAQYKSPAMKEAYERFRALLTMEMDRGGQRSITSLLAVVRCLPADLRAQLVEELAELPVRGEYVLEVIESALRAGSLEDSPVVRKILFDNLAKLLEKALREDDGAVIPRIVKLSESLPPEQQIQLPYAVESGNAIPDQATLLEKALGPLGQWLTGENTAMIGERVIELFGKAASRGRMSDAALLLARVVPLLPAQERRVFIAKGLDENLDLLWRAIHAGTPVRESNEMARQWLKMLLEEEMLPILNVDETLSRELFSGRYMELLKQLSTLGIVGPQVLQEERTSPASIKLLVRDSQSGQYTAEVTAREIRVWHLNPDNYAVRLGRVLDGFLALQPGTPTEESAWGVIRDQLERKKVSLGSPDFFRRLCLAVNRDSSRTTTRFQLYRSLLVPLLGAAEDDPTYVRILLGSFLSSAEAGYSAVELGELLPRVKLTLEDFREIYTASGSPALVGLYWKLLDGGRDRSKVIGELEALYRAGHTKLFSQLLGQLLDAQRNEYGTVARELLTRMPSLAGDARCFSAMLGACRRAAGEAGWPKFVSEIAEVLTTQRSRAGMGILARMCIERMRDLVRRGERISQAEDSVIDEWLKSEGQAERGLVTTLAIFREIQRLHEGASPKELLERSLGEFQRSKGRLAPDDFRVAARRVLGVFARCEIVATKESWNAVEEAATQNGDRRSQEFNSLMEAFLGDCAWRRDYPDLLAVVTLRWIRRWADYRESSGVLWRGYSLMESGRARQEYVDKVWDGLKKSGGAISQEGIEWWRNMVDPPREQGFFGRLFGR